MTRSRLRQGKCLPCGKGWRWPARLAELKNAACPDCGALLWRTTRLAPIPWQVIDTAPPRWNLLRDTNTGGDTRPPATLKPRKT